MSRSCDRRHFSGPLSLGAESVSGRTKDREDRVGNFVRSVIRLLNKNFPRLFEIMKQTLVAPGSTTGIERIFSVAGYILSERRTRTSDENFENQLVANVNLNLSESGVRKKLRLN